MSYFSFTHSIEKNLFNVQNPIERNFLFNNLDLSLEFRILNKSSQFFRNKTDTK